MELVRYIHLNPIRAGILKDLKGLNSYPYCGHYALMGRTEPAFRMSITFWISKKLNIASFTASESAMRGRKMVEEHGWTLLEEDKFENPRNVP